MVSTLVCVCVCAYVFYLIFPILVAEINLFFYSAFCGLVLCVDLLT